MPRWLATYHSTTCCTITCPTCGYLGPSGHPIVPSLLHRLNILFSHPIEQKLKNGPRQKQQSPGLISSIPHDCHHHPTSSEPQHLISDSVITAPTPLQAFPECPEISSRWTFIAFNINRLTKLTKAVLAARLLPQDRTCLGS